MVQKILRHCINSHTGEIFIGVIILALRNLQEMQETGNSQSSAMKVTKNDLSIIHPLLWDGGHIMVQKVLRHCKTTKLGKILKESSY